MNEQATCTHLDQVEYLEPAEPIKGCEDCLAIGAQWVHLRMCHVCGKIACCDDSPNRHMTAHFHASGHPLMRSVEPGEDWSWCFVDEVVMELSAD